MEYQQRRRSPNVNMPEARSQNADNGPDPSLTAAEKKREKEREKKKRQRQAQSAHDRLAANQQRRQQRASQSTTAGQNESQRRQARRESMGEDKKNEIANRRRERRTSQGAIARKAENQKRQKRYDDMDKNKKDTTNERRRERRTSHGAAARVLESQKRQERREDMDSDEKDTTNERRRAQRASQGTSARGVESQKRRERREHMDSDKRGTTNERRRERRASHGTTAVGGESQKRQKRRENMDSDKKDAINEKRRKQRATQGAPAKETDNPMRQERREDMGEDKKNMVANQRQGQRMAHASNAVDFGDYFSSKPFDPLAPWAPGKLGRDLNTWADMWAEMHKVTCPRCPNCGAAWFHAPEGSVLRGLSCWQDFGDEEFCAKCSKDPLIWANARLNSYNEINDLTPLEERCISIVQPIVSVFSYGSGGVSYQGHVTNTKCDVSTWVTTLPRDPRTCQFVLVKRRTQGAMGGAARPPFRVCVPRMLRALEKLKKLQHGVPNSYGCIEVGNLDLYKEVDGEGWCCPDFPMVEIEEAPDTESKICQQVFDLWVRSTLPMATTLRHLLQSSEGPPVGAGAPRLWDLARRAISNAATHDVEIQDLMEADTGRSMAECAGYHVFPTRWLLHLFPEAQSEPPCDWANIDNKDELEPPESEADPRLSELLQELYSASVAAMNTDDVENQYANEDLEKNGGKEDLDDWAKDEIIEGMLSANNISDQNKKGATQKKQPPRPPAPPFEETTGAGAGAGFKLPDHLARLFPWAQEEPPKPAPLRVEPPQATEVIPESTQGYVRCAFPKIFQDGKQCPTERPSGVPYEHWCLHLMQSSVAASEHHALRYFAYNTLQRPKAFSGNTTFLLKDAAEFDVDNLKACDKKKLMQKVIKASANIPGTIGSKQEIKQKLEAMAYQIDEEVEQIPGWFTTTSSAIYWNYQQFRWIVEWLAALGEAKLLLPLDEKTMRDLAARFPLIVAYFSAVRLELLMRFSIEMVKNDSAEDPATSPGSMDACAVFEWGQGGIPHTHGFQWGPKSVRIDNVLDELGEGDNVVGQKAALVEACQDLIDYCKERHSEWHPGIDSPEEFHRASELNGDSKRLGILHDDYMEILRHAQQSQCATTDSASGNDKADIVGGPVDASNEGEHASCPPVDRDNAQQQGKPTSGSAAPPAWARSPPMELVKNLLESVQFHDNHYPSPLGPPAPSQRCCKMDPKSGRLLCGKCFPREPESAESLRKDIGGRDITKYYGKRNNAFLNGCRPARLLAALSNCDDSPVTTLDALINYCSKYAAKGEDIKVETFDAALSAAKDQMKGGRSVLCKFFNKIIACSNMISANEVCHHFLELPEMIATREFAAVSLGPKARVINGQKVLGGVGESIVHQSRYEIYCEREASKAGCVLTHPMTQKVYTPEAFMKLLAGSSFYHYNLYFQSRSTNKGRITNFIRGKPKILMLRPWLNFTKPTDDNKWKTTLRLALRTFIVLPKHGLSDSILCSAPVEKLEELMEDLLAEMPTEIQRRWKRAKKQEQRKMKFGEVGKVNQEQKQREPKPEKAEQKMQMEEGGDEEDQELGPKLKRRMDSVKKSQLSSALSELCMFNQNMGKSALVRTWLRYIDWLKAQRRPKKPTAAALALALGHLGHSKAGNKAALVARLVLFFSTDDNAEAQLAAQQQKIGKVDRLIQELSSKGRNPFEDGRDSCYYAGIEKYILAEAQALTTVAEKIVDTESATDQGFCAEMDGLGVEHIFTSAPRPTSPRKARELGPTQGALPKISKRKTNKLMRYILTGLAGAGKSEVCYQIADGDRTCFAAPTGVAANNLAQLSAETVGRLLKLQKEELSDDDLNVLADYWQKITGLVIDEFSMIGRVKLAKVSRRLSEIFRFVEKRKRQRAGQSTANLPSPEEMFLHGFGHIPRIFLVGDMGQAPPVKDTPLWDRATHSGAQQYSHSLSNQGRTLFSQFLGEADAEAIETGVVRLRRTYRNPGLTQREIDFRDACVRLRDAAITPRDYELFQSMTKEEIHTQDWAKGAVGIVGDNERCGTYNGQSLAASGQTIHRNRAFFSKDSQRAAKHSEFEHLPSTSHLCIGAKVMLTTNTLNDCPVVKLGLSNGARGTVVGIRYTESGRKRLQYVYVDFPSYRGQKFFPGHEGRDTVVPIPMQTATSRSGNHMVIGMPLRLAHCLTVHKSQGLTIPEGVIIDWAGSMRIASSPLAFVAATRVTTSERIAMKNLPPFLEFLQAREAKLFKARKEVEAILDALHAKTMANLYEKSEVELHVEHIRACHTGDTSELEREVAKMLARPGVLPIPAQTIEQVRQLSGKQKIDWGDMKRVFANKGRQGVCTKLGQKKKGAGARFKLFQDLRRAKFFPEFKSAWKGPWCKTLERAWGGGPLFKQSKKKDDPKTLEELRRMFLPTIKVEAYGRDFLWPDNVEVIVYVAANTLFCVRRVGVSALVWKSNCTGDVGSVDLQGQLNLLSGGDIPALTVAPKKQKTPLSRQLNEAITRRAVEQAGKTIAHVPGDGHCLYHAIGSALAYIGHPDAPLLTVAYLREKVVGHAAHALSELGQDEIDQCRNAAQKGLAPGPCAGDAWGDENSLKTLTHALNLHATVYDEQSGNRLVYDDGPYAISLIRRGQHYDYLIDAEEQPEEAAGEPASKKRKGAQ